MGSNIQIADYVTFEKTHHVDARQAGSLETGEDSVIISEESLPHLKPGFPRRQVRQLVSRLEREKLRPPVHNQRSKIRFTIKLPV